VSHVSALRPLGPLAQSVERLARWWTEASQIERFECVKRAIEAEANAPSFEELRIAIYLAEVEAGEVG
jgi:hypothetical protein